MLLVAHRPTDRIDMTRLVAIFSASNRLYASDGTHDGLEATGSILMLHCDAALCSSSTYYYVSKIKNVIKPKSFNSGTSTLTIRSTCARRKNVMPTD